MGFFLNVERSLTGRPWRARLDAAGEARALAIAQASGQSELMARVLAGRGVALDRSRAPSRADLARADARPLCVARHGGGDAAPRARRSAGERVAIFGDYDVDGAASAALLSEYLEACGCPTMIHIPDRVAEGYGPNSEAMAAFANAGATLVVTVDCGAVSHEPIAEAKRLGLDVVVFDHHQAPERLPDALAVVDPNRQDDLSGLGYLSRRRRRLHGPRRAQSRASRGGLLSRARGARSQGRARSRRAGDRRRRRAARRPQPRLRHARPRRDAPARTPGPGGLVRRGGRRRAAARLSPRLSRRPAHQRGRPHRRFRARRAAVDDARRTQSARHRRRARPPQSRPPADRIGCSGRGRSGGAARAGARGARRGGGGGGRGLAVGRRWADRGAAEGAFRAARLCAGPEGARGDGLGALDSRRRSRPRRALGRRSGSRAEGRRPRHGGGRDTRRRAGSANSAPFSRKSSPSRSPRRAPFLAWRSTPR